MDYPTPGLERYSGKRWLILGIAWLTTVVVSVSMQLIPPFSFTLVPDLNLSLSNLMMLFTAPSLAAIVFSIPGGALGDRLGPRLVVGIGVFISAIFGFLRAYSPSFPVEFVMSALMGVGWAFTVPNLPKVVALWFPPGQVGLASGLYLTAIPVAGILSFSTTVPLYGGNWKLGFITMGLICLIVSMVWWAVIRNRPAGVAAPKPAPVVSGLLAGLKSKNIWFLALGYAALNGGFNAFAGITTQSLETVHNISPAIASLAVSAVVTGSVLSFLVPMLSDRAGLRKPFLITSALVSFVLLFIAWYTAFHPWTWVLLLIAGFFIGPIPAFLLTIPMELPEIRHDYVGSACGVITTIGNAANFLIPSFLIPALATPDMNISFLACTGIVGSIAIFSLFLRETGLRARKIPAKAA